MTNISVAFTALAGVVAIAVTEGTLRLFAVVLVLVLAVASLAVAATRNSRMASRANTAARANVVQIVAAAGLLLLLLAGLLV